MDMSDSSPKFSHDRCPKCGRHLPELPPYSVCRCGGCDSILKAHKTSPLSGYLSSNSSEGRFGEGNQGGVVGIDHDSERSTPIRVSMRLTSGDLTPVTKTNSNVKLYGRRCVEQKHDDWDDDKSDRGVERRNMHISSNYRAELLREYNELHEKLIRVGDLISSSQTGEGDQGCSSRYCYGGSDEHDYDEFSGNRIRSVRSYGLKGSSRMKTHRVTDKPHYNHHKFTTEQPIDSTCSPRRKCIQQGGSVGSRSDAGFCHPIAGGAPFVICHKCFQLLRLPAKLITTNKSKSTLQCGSCHTRLALDFDKPNSANVNDVLREVPRDSAVEGLLPLCPPPCSPSRDQDKGAAQRESFGKSFVAANGAVQTELKLKSNEIPNIGLSQGSADTNIRRDQVRCSEPNSRSSFANADVSVNGILINPNVVRKAEKMAGPISPGEYWYDSRAGFWGAMGDHCLGIIPPFIEEFSSQMSENCSGGETCIYINGRELHENDLSLLSTRGLPRTRFKYYVVDISGKVQDKDTGAFVVNLGKLAPTVESTGCGFGMHFLKNSKSMNKNNSCN